MKKCKGKIYKLNACGKCVKCLMDLKSLKDQLLFDQSKGLKINDTYIKILEYYKYDTGELNG